MFPHRNNPYFVEDEKVHNLARIAMFVSFSIGACSSAILFPVMGYKGFFIVAAISTVLTITALWNRRDLIEKQKIFSAADTFVREPMEPRPINTTNSATPLQERQAAGMANR